MAMNKYVNKTIQVATWAKSRRIDKKTGARFYFAWLLASQLARSQPTWLFFLEWSISTFNEKKISGRDELVQKIKNTFKEIPLTFIRDVIDKCKFLVNAVP